MRPLLLDLFCGAGGAARGYDLAGFDVIGVDRDPQPSYPYRLIVGDALEVGRLLGPSAAVVHASPPCQHFTAYGRARKDLADRYEDLIIETRQLLRGLGRPYVIENVEGAPLLEPLLLCGSMFDLDVRRHRLFEADRPLEPPVWPCRHRIWSRRFKPASNRTGVRYTIEVGSWDEPLERQKAAMGVDWPITVRELSEAIPPAYSKFVGEQLLERARLEHAA